MQSQIRTSGKAATAKAEGLQMGTGDVIAGYAAALSTILAVWQVWRHWQSRRHQVELHLVHTSVGSWRSLFVEVHNRGDHAVRVVLAGISSPRITYTLRDDRVHISDREGRTHITVSAQDAGDEHSEMPTIPGIVLPRDGGMASLREEICSVALATLMQAREEGDPQLQGMTDHELSTMAVLDFDGPLQGWAHLSTGEVVETRMQSYAWPGGDEPARP